jgi:hypothetical protein
MKQKKKIKKKQSKNMSLLELAYQTRNLGYETGATT